MLPENHKYALPQVGQLIGYKPMTYPIFLALIVQVEYSMPLTKGDKMAKKKAAKKKKKKVVKKKAVKKKAKPVDETPIQDTETETVAAADTVVEVAEQTEGNPSVSQENSVPSGAEPSPENDPPTPDDTAA